MTKVYIFIFLYLSLGITVISLKRIAKTKDEQLFRYTKTECSSSNMSVSGYFCYIKAFSRSVTSISFGANVTKKLNLMNILHSMEYKYGTIYRPVVETPIFEYCGMFAGVSSNILMNMTMAVMKESVPDFFHKCPYTGIIAAYNMTIKADKLFSIFPSGDYRSHFIISDKTDPKIYQLTFLPMYNHQLKHHFK